MTINKKLFHSVFAGVCERYPAAGAIETSGITLSYQQLDRASRHLAARLTRLGCGRGDVVGLYLPASPLYVLSLLGVARAGAAFMPLDVRAPAHRLAQMCSQTRPRCLITTADLQDALAESGYTAASLMLLDQTDLIQGSAALSACSGMAEPDDLAYVIFTSGSTGKPKAIAGQHKGLSHFIHWEMQTFGLVTDCRTAFMAAPTFDVSLRDILVPLLAGGTLCIPAAEERQRVDRLIDWLERARINTLHCVPSLFRLMIRELDSQARPERRLSSLQRILLAGEPLYARDVLAWRAVQGESVELVNLYGPSETTLAKAFHRITTVPVQGSTPIPVGQALPNTLLLVIKGNRLCGPGEIGEIHIKTPFRTLGYYQDPEQTARCFIPNPLTGEADDIVYRTGDMGRYLPDQGVELLGRLDNQIKLNGVRIELGDVEQAVLAHEAPREAVVVLQTLKAGEQALVCYYVVDTPLSPQALREFVASRLPEAMIPAYFVEMAALPLNLHGKVDRKALPLPEAVLYQDQAFVPAETPLQTRLAAIWAEVLGLERVSIDHRFLETGGNSLKAMRVLSRILGEIRVDINLRDFFAHDTVRTLAACIENLSASRLPALIPREPRPDYPLTHAQTRMWVLQQMHIDAIAYSLPEAQLIEGELDVKRLEQALTGLISRHESLRTVFVETVDGLRQKILPEWTVNLPVLDYRLATDAEIRVSEHIAADHLQAFDLARGPLFRTTLYRLPDGSGGQPRHIWSFNIHHIITDGWSLRILIEELGQLYRGESLVALPLHYRDYSLWLDDLSGSEIMQAQADYWHRRLADEPEPLDLRTDRPRPAVQTFKGATLHRVLEAEITRSLNALCQRQGVSLFMLLAASLQTLLYRYTGQTDITLGTVVHGRTDSQLDQVVGLFVNTLVLRSPLAGHERFCDRLAAMKTAVLEAFDHALYPFDRLVNEVAQRRDMSRHPLFDVMLVHQNIDVDPLRLGETRVTDFGQAHYWETSRFDLTLHVSEETDHLRLDWNYNLDLFLPQTVTVLMAHFERLLQAVVAECTLTLQDLSLMGEAEQQRVIVEFNDANRVGSSSVAAIPALGALFARQVDLHGDRVAVCLNERTLTYRQLDHCADRLAEGMRNGMGVAPGDVVGLLTAREPEWIALILAIFKLGACYLPLDPALPTARLTRMLDRAGCRHLVAAGTDSSHGIIARHWSELQAEAALPAPADPAPSRQATLLYLIFTSGSSGEPKGVLVEQAGFVNMIQDQIRKFGITPQDRVLQFASAGFDASLHEIFVCLSSGAALVLIPSGDIQDTGRFVTRLQQQAVSVATLPPTYLQLLGHQTLPGLRILITAGEAARAVDARFHAGYLRYFNAYGPTECSVCASTYEVLPGITETAVIPIGKPVDNIRIYVLDDRLAVQPLGIPGEICLAGIGLARGYLADEDLTRSRFIEHPLEPGGRLYRTGDRGFWNPDGELVYLGRLDDQIKLSGYRIEPGEIAATLHRHPDLADAAVVLQDDPFLGPHLHAYCVARRKPVELWPSIAEFHGYDDVVYHAMATHESRHDRYRRAFARVLRDQVVLEVGPGPEAVLSRLAIECGASKVYAVELLEETFNKARATVHSLGLSDRITVIHGNALTLTLPEKADYCIAEIMGSIAGSEGAAVIINAVRHHLTHPAHVLPQRSETRFAAIELGEDQLDWGFSPIAIHHLERVFDQAGQPFDLRLCVKGTGPEQLLSGAGIFEDLDYTREIPLTHTHEVELNINRPGCFTGFLIWLTLAVDVDEVVDTLIEQTGWLPVYLPVSLSGWPVEAGDRLQLRITRQSCEQGSNPDYLLEGRLLYRDGREISLACSCPHKASGFRQQPFYQRLFAEGEWPQLPQPDEAELKHHLAKTLPTYMIPARFTLLPALPLTAAGKLDRARLPRFVPGRTTETDESLTPGQQGLQAAWLRVLGRKPGLHDNFFSLGGDSIKAIQVAGWLQEQGLRIEVSDIFQQPTLAGLATLLKTSDVSAEQGQLTGPVPLNPIQSWFFSQSCPVPQHFNQVVELACADRFDIPAVHAALTRLQTHHDALRTRFHDDSGTVRAVQQAVDYPVRLHCVDLTGHTEAELAMTRHAEAQQVAVDLAAGPLMQGLLYHRIEGDRLLLIIHHLVVDGYSWRILIDDFWQCYTAARTGVPVTLPKKTHAFKTWNQALQTFAGSDTLKRERGYWLSQVERARDNQLMTHTLTGSQAAAASLNARWDRTMTREFMIDARHTVHAQPDELLVTALALAFRRSWDIDCFLIDREHHGRDWSEGKLNPGRTVGWFTVVYPQVITLPDSSLGQQIEWVKTTFSAVPHQGLGYGILRYLAHDEALALPPAPVILNFLGDFTGSEPEGNIVLNWDPPVYPVNQANPLTHALNVQCMVVDGCMQLELIYDTTCYTTVKVQLLFEAFNTALGEIIEYSLGRVPATGRASGFTLDTLDESDLTGLIADL